MANKKITELGALTTPAGTDILAIVDDTDTTTKKVSVTDLMTLAPVQTADIANFSPAFYSTVSETGTSRTLSDSDNGKVIVCTNAATITVTIPSTLTAGFSCKLVQGGAGIVGAVAGSGTTLSLIGGKAYTSGQYQVVDLINYASNAYVLDSNSLQTDPAAWSGNGHSLSFDGVSDHCTFTQTTFSSSTARTFSFWYKFSAATNTIFGFIGGTTNYIGLNPSNGFIYVYDGSAASYKSTTTPGTTNWHNLIVVDTTTAINMYLDGSNIGVVTGGSRGDLTFEYIARKASDYYPGLLDEVAVWDSDQSSNASTIWNSGTPDDLTALSPLHWWRMGDFEGGTGTTITDQGSSGTLTLTKQGASASTDTP